MSPDSLEATRQRRAWRFISALGCLLGATGILLAAILSSNVRHYTNKVDQQGHRGNLAICAIIDYGEATLKDIHKNPVPEDKRQRRAVSRFKNLVQDMKATGIECPPPPQPRQ